MISRSDPGYLSYPAVSMNHGRGGQRAFAKGSFAHMVGLALWEVVDGGGGPPVVIPNVKGNTTTTKFGSSYITRGSDGTSYTKSKFGSGWITRSSDGKNYTTTKFGDGAVTSGNGEQVTTSRFGSGTISRSSDGATTNAQVKQKIVTFRPAT